LSTQYSTIVGSAAFHLDTGAINVRLENAPEGEGYDVWLTSRTPESKNVGIEAADRFTRLGTITGAGYADARLDVNVTDISQDVLDLDLVVVTHAGKTPLDEALLLGMPTLFERVWTRERAGDATPTAMSSGMSLALIQSFTPPLPGSTPDFELLVTEGEVLFFEKKFEGNGRTCGTCHPAENNLTLDPTLIQQMHDADPMNPLFVAEFDPNLMESLNGGQRFEIPHLMLKQGLILENVDGFGDLKKRFVMRAISHVFAQSVSIKRPVGGVNPPKQRTGWGGDGAPVAGTLRDFAIGAVTQHFTRSFGRQNGVDFVLPNDQELDALEAFQLSLGRDADPNITGLTFNDPSAQEAVSLFQGRCDRCHTDAGANSFFNFDGNTFQFDPNLANGNFNTNVERRLQGLIGGPIDDRPFDGGLGVIPVDPVPPNPNDITPNFDGSFGDKTFNTPSIVEAADTTPSFHNNLTALTDAYTSTIEDAIRFYASDEFVNSTGAQVTGTLADQGLPGTIDSRVKILGRLMRSINALENARSARAFAARAQFLGNLGADEFLIQRALQVAHADCGDGRDVQSEISMNDVSVDHFQQAMDLIQQAQDSGLPWSTRSALIDDALIQIDSARSNCAT